MRKKFILFCAGLILTVASAPRLSEAGVILALGFPDGFSGPRTNLVRHLDLGINIDGSRNTVTTAERLPDDLSAFDTIWHVDYFAPLTADEQSRLASFLARGGGVHLTGELPGFFSARASIETFINSVVIGGGITVGTDDTRDLAGYPTGPFFLNPNAHGNITVGGDDLILLSPGALSGLGILPDPNILATAADGTVVGGIWRAEDLVGGQGALTLMMDQTWFEFPVNTGEVFGSIEVFLESGARPVSEPGSLALLGLGMIGMGVVVRRRHRFSSASTANCTMTRRLVSAMLLSSEIRRR